MRAASEQPADNSVCLVCHLDFAEEEITAKHRDKGIGCEYCHGESADHGNDELNVTPPDVRFGRAEVQVFCKACHPVHKIGDTYDAFVRQWQGKRRPNGRLILPRSSSCTDCHGHHVILRPDQQGVL